jgi:hypothetical protein
VPDGSSIIGAVLGAIGDLMPKAGILTVLVFLSQAGQSFGVLGGLVGLVAAIYLIIVGVRWIYATIISGSGEAQGDAAFERSEATVRGSWWGTFGCYIVIGLATLIPVFIAAGIARVIVPTPFLSALVSTVVMVAIGIPIFGSALESAWAQVEGADGPGDGHVPVPPASHEAPQPPATPQPPTSDGPFV